MKKLSAGEHTVCIVHTQVKPTRNGGAYIELTLEALFGGSKGCRHIDRLNYVNANARVEQMAAQRFAEYREAISLGASEFVDYKDLCFSPFMVELGPQRRAPEKLEVKNLKPVPLGFETEANKAAVARGRLLSQQDDASRGPVPLSRGLPPAPAFPMEALGPILSGAAVAITDIVQCPAAIAAQSVLGAASLAVQGHANVIIPATGDARPVSLFLLTVAESGERKSAADGKALFAANAHEREQFKRYDADLPSYNTRRQAWEIERKQADRLKGNRNDIERALELVGPPPEPPLKPLLTCNEPTYEGLYKLFEAGMPSLGLFSDEGAHFVSGHGMKLENQLAMAAGLSSLWDGAPMKRVRATGEATMLAGRRLSMHLMMQPDVAAELLSNAKLKDQGLLSRMLVCAPDPKAGTRFQRPPNWSSQSALAAYNGHIANILATTLPLADGARNELEPRNLHLSAEAADLWRGYADDVEHKTAPDGEYAPIKSLANKLPEHALRLAAVIALVELGPGLPNIPANAFRCGMQLADFYASEALRLWDRAIASPDIRLAKKLLTWLHKKGMASVELPTIYQNGPGELREATPARRIAKILEEHEYLIAIPGDDDSWWIADSPAFAD